MLSKNNRITVEISNERKTEMFINTGISNNTLKHWVKSQRK